MELKGLLIVLYLGITPSCAWGIIFSDGESYFVPGNLLRSAICKASTQTPTLSRWDISYILYFKNSISIGYIDNIWKTLTVYAP